MNGLLNVTLYQSPYSNNTRTCCNSNRDTTRTAPAAAMETVTFVMCVLSSVVILNTVEGNKKRYDG